MISLLIRAILGNPINPGSKSQRLLHFVSQLRSVYSLFALYSRLLSVCSKGESGYCLRPADYTETEEVVRKRRVAPSAFRRPAAPGAVAPTAAT